MVGLWMVAHGLIRMLRISGFDARPVVAHRGIDLAFDIGEVEYLLKVGF